MKKPHTVTVEELQDWLTKEYITFASSPYENKRLIAYVNGNLEVRVGLNVVWQGTQPFEAVEQYNAITERFDFIAHQKKREEFRL